MIDLDIPADHNRLDDDFWRQPLEPDYWRALLTQGELAPTASAPDGGPSTGGDQRAARQVGGEPPGTDSTDPGRMSVDGSRWRVAEEALEQGSTFTVRVSGANRGGLLVDWDGVQGFVPASHLRLVPRRSDQQERAAELAARVGDWLTVRLIEVDVAQKRLVFSERAGQRTGPSRVEQGASQAVALSQLASGDVRHGVVTNVTSFGAFVDLGGVEGLVHVSEISWDRVQHPGDGPHGLAPGQRVEVMIIGVNPDQERIALSIKRLRPNPWSLAADHYQVGQIVEGTVTNVVSFGAFVRLDEGLEGLIHISELAEGNFLHPRNVVREGDVVKVRVLTIDTANHRLGLSLRQAYNAGLEP